MPFITQGKTNLKYILIVVILAAIVGGGILVYYYLWMADLESRITVLELKLPEKITKDETANWKVYRNEEFGFQLKYPRYLTVSSLGPNSAMQQAERGETISGTVQPSYDTIVFSNKKNEKQFEMEIFGPTEKILSESGYQEDYFYLYGLCDLRWGFKPTSTHIINITNIEILEVKSKTQGCYYFKNYNKNLMVLSTERFNEQQDFEEIASVLQAILSTFRFLE